MLKGIPAELSPELLKVLAEMGHSDEIVIADGNFPGVTMGKRVIRCDATDAVSMLEAIMKVFPLDAYVPKSVFTMKPGPEFEGEPVVWDAYRKILKDEPHFNGFQEVERFDFYEQAKNAFAVVITSETAIYACIILKKGVL